MNQIKYIHRGITVFKKKKLSDREMGEAKELLIILNNLIRDQPVMHIQNKFKKEIVTIH